MRRSSSFLAETFSLPKSPVVLVSGESSRSKVFRLRGITAGEAEEKLRALRNSVLVLSPPCDRSKSLRLGPEIVAAQKNSGAPPFS